MKKSDVFRKLVKLRTDADVFMNSIPSPINDAIFDNDYSNSQGLMIDMLTDEYFGKHAESVYWFLYEWKPGYTVSIDGKEKGINSLDEYIKWMIEHEDFE